MPDLSQFTITVGLLMCVVIATISIFRKRRIHISDLGLVFAAFLAGNNLPAGIWLCLYGIFPDPPSIATKLHGYEKYVALAGACLFFVGLASLWSLAVQAYALPLKSNSDNNA